MPKNLLFSVPDLTAPEPIDNSDQVTFAIILIAVIIALIVIPIVFNAIQKAREKKGKNDITILICNRCGRVVSKDDTFCPKCGSNLYNDSKD